jgi:alkanesulfonate monooxygenase SsuD/methylene tetrahydromethanopterin reductase-like flavin-dependent oxidoreductase (luciferase family)
VVAALGHIGPANDLIARSADVGFITPHDPAQVTAIVDEIAAARQAADRTDPVHVFADVTVFLADTARAAADRRERLDELAGAEYASDAEIFVGTPAQLADLLTEWRVEGVSGFRLRPAGVPHDLHQIADSLVPDLQRRGLFRTAYEADTLRGLLGLERPANRYAAV